MAYPYNLAEILEYMGYENETDFSVADNLDGKGPYFVTWRHTDPKPTEKRVKSAGTKMDTVKGPERRWTTLRLRRTAELVKSDWTQVADSPLSSEQRIAWQRVRQHLRDLPQDCPKIRDAEARLQVLIANKPKG